MDFKPNIKIKLAPKSSDSMVEVNGENLSGVVAVQINCDINSGTTAKIESFLTETEAIVLQENTEMKITIVDFDKDNEIKRLENALKTIAEMPEYDQDDSHRLRHSAKQALEN